MSALSFTTRVLRPCRTNSDLSVICCHFSGCLLSVAVEQRRVFAGESMCTRVLVQRPYVIFLCAAAAAALPSLDCSCSSNTTKHLRNGTSYRHSQPSE